MTDFIHFNEATDEPKDRCQSSNAAGPCNYHAINGTKHCPRHGGSHALGRQKKEDLRNYRLNKFRQQVAQKADSPQIKNLNEEVGILRLTLESLINQCQDETDLLLYSSKIGDLVTRIEKVVLSCQKLEEKDGQLLDKSQILSLATQFINIIVDNVNDPAIVTVVSEEIEAAVLNIGTEVII